MRNRVPGGEKEKQTLPRVYGFNQGSTATGAVRRTSGSNTMNGNRGRGSTTTSERRALFGTHANSTNGSHSTGGAAASRVRRHVYTYTHAHTPCMEM